jgi:XRE family aerobic/anaerobic benzoate catabolism transcriptional regulator
VQESALDNFKPVHYSAHMSELLKALGTRIRENRLAGNWSQAELAQRSGVSRRFLVQVEAGEGNASLLRLAELAQALDCSLVSLLAGLGPIHDELDVLADQASRLGADAQQDLLRTLQNRGNKIALIGLRGAGKSTIGLLAAQRANCAFVELDLRVAQVAGMSLGELFEYHGAEGYRSAAIEALEQVLSEPDRAIIEVGGSLVLDERAMDLLKEHSRLIWLQATPEAHLHRVREQGDVRPMAGRSDPLGELRTILQRRSPVYSQAPEHVNTVDVGIEGAVEAILG